MIFGEAKRAVVTVGEGRGFVVEGERNRFVVTAAHCLPFFPPCITASYTEERTYKTLLGPLGKKPSVWTECLFADPIGDIAVLGPPDNQELANEYILYDELMEMAEPLEIADPPKKCPAWLLSLNGQWFRCTVQHNNGTLWISETAEAIIGGMSGSPLQTMERRLGSCARLATITTYIPMLQPGQIRVSLIIYQAGSCGRLQFFSCICLLFGSCAVAEQHRLRYRGDPQEAWCPTAIGDNVHLDQRVSAAAFGR
jgi:hypothetical protein